MRGCPLLRGKQRSPWGHGAIAGVIAKSSVELLWQRDIHVWQPVWYRFFKEPRTVAALDLTLHHFIDTQCCFLNSVHVGLPVASPGLEDSKHGFMTPRAFHSEHSVASCQPGMAGLVHDSSTGPRGDTVPFGAPDLFWHLTCLRLLWFSCRQAR